MRIERGQKICGFGLVGTVVLLALSAGCSQAEPGCRSDDDCRSGRLCVERACLTPGELPDTGSGDLPDGLVFANNTSGADGGSDAGAPEDVSAPQEDVLDSLDGGSGPEDVALVDVDAPEDVAVPPVDGTRTIRIFPAMGFTFGQVSLGTRIITDFVVENRGDEPLTMREVAIAMGANSPYGLSPTIGPNAARELEPGARQRFELTFSPETVTPFEGSVNIRSNATNDPDASLSLAGRGVNPSASAACIGASPNGFSFGALEVGDAVELTVTVFNCSRFVPLQIVEIGVSGTGTPVFTATPGENLPIALQPGQGKSVTVKFAPAQGRNYQESLTFRGDVTVNQAARVQLSGTGINP